MHASVVGSGYVGTTVAACLADLGHDVVAVDRTDFDRALVDHWIQSRPTPTVQMGISRGR
jgi:UDPglucose 6-dehydrogenase